MKKALLTSIIGILVTNFIIGQNMQDYNAFVAKADSLYNVEEYSQSSLEFEKAFDASEGKAFPHDRYNAACSFALSGNSEKAFYHLIYLAEHKLVKYKDYNHITTDTDLNSLHNDERWNKLIELVKANKEEAEKNLDKSLVAILDSIYEEDQKYRAQIDGIEKKYGRDSKEMQKHWGLINQKDKRNVIEIQKILDERGWLGADVIGEKGNTTLFVVIQHASLEIQEKYLPMMRDAVKQGNARAGSLALLEDRVALGKVEKQIYGSQIGRIKETGEYYLLPLIDPDNVNNRRTEVGLGPIEEYIFHWDMSWDVEDYKKKLPDYEALQKGK